MLSFSAWDPALARPSAFTFVAFFLPWMLFVLAVWTTWPAQDHGTRMADSNILNAAKNYEAYGLLHHHGVPQLETYADSERPPTLYPTYPPGPYWIHALLRKAGLRELAELRGASVVGSMLAGLLGLCAFSMLTRSWLVGSLAAFFYCFSAPFTSYADSVHMNVWMQIGLFCFLMAWVGFERGRGRWRWALLGLAALAYFFEIWMTFEHIVLIAIVVAVRTIISRRMSVWIGGAILALVCLGGLATRVLHLVPEYGTMDAAVDRLIRKYLHRSGEGGVAQRAGVPITEVIRRWVDQLHWTTADASRQREFGYPLLYLPVLVCMVGLLGTICLSRVPVVLRSIRRAKENAAGIGRSLGRAGPAARVGPRETLDALHDARLPALRATRAGLGWGVLLFVASLHWHVGMRQHAAIHPHIILNMLPGMALILGSLAAGGLRLAMPDAAGTSRVRWLGLPLSLAMMAFFMVHLRHSPVVNRAFRLDAAMRSEMRSREEANQWWRDLGDALRTRYEPIRRIVLYHWGPPQANFIGLPHQYVDAGAMPRAFGLAEPGSTEPSEATDLLLIEYPRRDRTPQIVFEEGIDRIGMPEIQTGPDCTALIFASRAWAGAGPTIDCDVRFLQGLRIEAVRLSETIAGDAYVVSMIVQANNPRTLEPQTTQTTPSGSQAITTSIAAHIRVLDADSHRIGVFTPRVDRRPTYRNRSLVWAIIPKDRLPAGASIHLALLDHAQERVGLHHERLLGPGMSIDTQSDEIIWKVTLP